jgi:hypothetical protein
MNPMLFVLKFVLHVLLTVPASLADILCISCRVSTFTTVIPQLLYQISCLSYCISKSHLESHSSPSIIISQKLELLTFIHAIPLDLSVYQCVELWCWSQWITSWITFHLLYLKWNPTTWKLRKYLNISKILYWRQTAQHRMSSLKWQ